MNKSIDSQSSDQNATLLEQIQKLPKEIEPNRDLWPGIEQAINSQPVQKEATNDSHWNRYTKIVASFAPVALVLGLWFLSSSDNNFSTESPKVFNPIAASFDIQKRQLLVQVSNRAPVLENWQQSLKELEQAERALITALQSQPEDPALMKMLHQVYQQQLALIERAHKPELANSFNQI